MICLYLYSTFFPQTHQTAVSIKQMRKLGKFCDYIPATDRLKAGLKNSNYSFKKNIKGIR